MKKQSRTLFLLVGIILLGALLRFHDINRVPLRGDEAFTLIHWVREPFSQTLENIATADPQPPLAYILFHVWGKLVGVGEYTVRFLPALFNTLGIAVLYALGKRIGGARVGLTAALLWALHPYQLWHAQDARGYAIWAALSPLALWLALRALERGRRVDWVLYVIAAIIAAYIYYLELFSLAIITLYAFMTYRADRRKLLQWITALVIIGAALAPWFFQARLLFGSGYGGTAGRFDPTLLITWFVPSLMFSEIMTFPLGLTAFLLVLFAVGLWKMYQVNNRHWLLTLLMGTLPLLLIGVVSLRLNVFVPRYVLMVSAIYVVLIAYVIGAVQYGKYTRLWSGSLLIFVVGVNSVVISNYFLTDYAKSPDWRALASYLFTNVERDSQVIQLAADEAYTLYHTDYHIPSEPLRLPASDHQSVEEIETTLATISETASSIWVVAQPPPGWANSPVVDLWLNAHMQPVRETHIGGLRALEFRRWNVSADEITNPIAHFDDVAQLVGYRVFAPEPTGELTLWLYWQPIAQSSAPLTVFVHVIGGINPATGTPLWSQQDHEPQNARARTTLWSVDTLYRDVFEIPVENVPPGRYHLEIGWYDPATGLRIPVEGGDSYILTEITLP